MRWAVSSFWCRRIKGGGYTEIIGTDIGTEGAAVTEPDLSTVLPAITAIINGAQVDIGWGGTDPSSTSAKSR